MRDSPAPCTVMFAKDPQQSVKGFARALLQDGHTNLESETPVVPDAGCGLSKEPESHAC